MAKRIEYQCDGCDKTIKTDVGKQPTGWGTVSISITGLNVPFDYKGTEKVKTFDLCATCQQRALYSAYPDEWSRHAQDVSHDPR